MRHRLQSKFLLGKWLQMQYVVLTLLAVCCIGCSGKQPKQMPHVGRLLPTAPTVDFDSDAMPLQFPKIEVFCAERAVFTGDLRFETSLGQAGLLQMRVTRKFRSQDVIHATGSSALLEPNETRTSFKYEIGFSAPKEPGEYTAQLSYDDIVIAKARVRVNSKPR
ncbi:hypothetical protein Q31a_35930 [Aureliella helgolandensis]|uniref:Uncharacterized protein n=1 Tax=Aureliella helgolandensis TaxID=2527968 RepID=A0A518G9M8_9BACT|nr:hypothetical protein Q31a_35930 [Aureliella helgolandensis]